MGAVDEVKAKLDIVDVVGGYVRLQKAGRQFKANCPFHNEKTPSFYVNPDRQSWHCFGACSTGGDVIAFISRKENLDFTGALRLLAERAGVELRGEGPRRQEMKTLQDANEAAAVFYHGLLQSTAEAAGRARAYVDERGIDAKAIGDFQLGYAPAGWDGLRNHLTSRGFSEAQLADVGLLIEGERSAYDRFRNRLMFPIRDDRGRVVGFGGRVLPPGSDNQPDQGPKYMNTPQTAVFDKGAVLYGLDRAKDEIRRAGSAVIVEGYMDVIAAHQFGHRNVVASMGTALTDKQASLLQRFAERVVLAMDADEAGSAANLRAIQVVAGADRSSRGGTRPRSLDIRVLSLPRGKDPDELIRGGSEDGADGWPLAVASARPVVDHLIAVVSSGLDLSQPRDRSMLVTEVLPAIGDVIDPVLRAHYLQRLSRLARISEDALRRELPRRASARGNGSPREAVVRVAPVVKPNGVTRAKEQFCLALLHRTPELAVLATNLREDMFSLSEYREIYRRWRDGQPILEEEAELWDSYQEILNTRIPMSETPELERAFLDCMERLERVTIRAVKEASALALADGETGVRPGQVASIARARLEAGNAEETLADGHAEAVASQLLEDMEAGLRFHRRLIEGSRPDQQGPKGLE